MADYENMKRNLILFLTIVVCSFFACAPAAADANGQAWVICDPESYVNIRTGTGKKHAEIGGATCGTRLMTDSIEKNGYLHVVDLNAEEEEGWINLRYIVFDEPHQVMRTCKIVSNARVACRKGVDGKVIRWVKNGDEIFVYWMSASWAVTNRGYIKSRYIAEGR